MIYLDTSVALAQLLAEDRHPPAALWSQPLVASRLLEYEVGARLNAHGLGASHGEAARRLLERLAMLAIHLASIAFLRARGADVTLATYDERVRVAARALGFPLAPLGA